MAAHARQLRGPARVLLLIDQLMLAEGVKLALNHGHALTRIAQDCEEAMTTLRAWRPAAQEFDAARIPLSWLPSSSVLFRLLHRMRYAADSSV